MLHNGALSELPKMIDKLGSFENIVMICDTNTYRVAGSNVEKMGLKLKKSIILNADGLHANELGVALAEKELPEGFDLLLAVGSGTVHDITRYIAYNTGVSFVSVPTAASVDGYVSTVAAMTWNGVKRTFTAVGPIAMVADSGIIAKAPAELTAAGVGDLLGKYISLTEWKMGNILTGEYYCPEIVKLMSEAVNEVVENIESIAAAENEGIEKLMYGLVLSGLAMQMSGNSRPASGAEHHISHFIEMGVAGRNDTFHGEKVGVATALVCDRYHELIKLSACELGFNQENAVGKDEIERVFSSLSEEIINENKVSPLSGITAEKLAKKWDEICALYSSVPTGDEIRRLIKLCGGSTTLSDIKLSDELKDTLFRYSPSVRNRLTLMRIATGFKKMQN